MKSLDGVRVLELGGLITAPLCAMMLADLGADVIKIENPAGGDAFRAFRGKHYAPRFVAYNRGKRSVALDFTTAAGRGALLDLVRDADVVIENFRPGVLDRLDLGHAVLQQANPRVIHCSITGFGADGPYRQRPAFDAVGTAISGIASLFVDPQHPELTGPTIADNATGMYACYGILGALYERERTGIARYVEVNMLECSIAFMPDPFANALDAGATIGPLTRVAASQSYAFACADGALIAIQLSTQDKFWRGLLVATEQGALADDDRFADREARIANYVALRETLRAVFARRPRAEWEARLEAADVPFAPLHTLSEVVDDPQVRHLGTFSTLSHAGEGTFATIRRPVRMDGDRGEPYLPAPALGEHTKEILGAEGCL